MYVKKSTAELAQLYLKETQKNSFFTRADVVPRLLDLKVCPRCGQPALKTQGYARDGTIQCVTRGCGYKGTGDKFYDVQMHLMDGGLT